MEPERSVGQIVAALVVLGGPCVFALFRPAPFWRLRFLFTSWAYRDGEPPPPSQGGLLAVRLVAGLLLVMVVVGTLQARDGTTGARPLTSDTTGPTTPGAPGGLECEMTERVITVQSEYATNADGAVDLENGASGPDEAVQEYRAEQFPSLTGPPEKRGENEFVFRDSTGRVSLVILAASAPEGWYVSLHHACERFEAQARTTR